MKRVHCSSRLSVSPEGRHVFSAWLFWKPVKWVCKQIVMKIKQVFSRFPRLEERKNQDAATLEVSSDACYGRSHHAQPALDEPQWDHHSRNSLITFKIFKTRQCSIDWANANKALSIADRGYFRNRLLSCLAQEVNCSLPMKSARLNSVGESYFLFIH